MLADAVRRTLPAAEIAGIRALVVHAKNDDVRSFYERIDFAPSPTDPLHLFALISDLRKIYTTNQANIEGVVCSISSLAN